MGYIYLKVMVMGYSGGLAFNRASTCLSIEYIHRSESSRVRGRSPSSVALIATVNSSPRIPSFWQM